MQHSIAVWCLKSLAVLVLLAGCAPDGAQPSVAPRWTVPKVVDIADVAARQKHYVSIPVSNSGNTPLRINAVKASCGCMEAQLDQYEVLPGRSKTVSVLVDVGSKEGPFAKSCGIYTNDPDLPVQRVLIKGRAIASSSVYPSWFHLGDVWPGQVVDLVAELLDAETDSVSVAESATDLISQRVSDGNLQLQFRVPSDVGQFERRLSFDLRSGRQSRRAFVTVMGDVQQDLAVRPRTVTSKQLSSEDGARFRIRTGPDFGPIEGVSSGSPGVEIVADTRISRSVRVVRARGRSDRLLLLRCHTARRDYEVEVSVVDPEN